MNASVIAHCCTLRGGTTAARFEDGALSAAMSVNRTVTGSRFGFITPMPVRTSGWLATWEYGRTNWP